MHVEPNRAGLRRALALLILATLPPAHAMATAVFVDNHSFENPAIPADSFSTSAPPPGWSAYGFIDNGWRAVGVLNPATTELYLDPVPDGANVGVTFLGPEDMGSPAGMQQTLAATVQAATLYTLTVEVGNLNDPGGLPYDFSGFPGYRIELLGGGGVLVSDDDTLLPGEGRFLTSSIQVYVPAGHASVGQPLGIRLINLDADEGIEVNFDDVRLDAEGLDCPPEIPAGCKVATPGKAMLSLSRKEGAPAKNNVGWSWRGEETSLEDLGSPDSTSDYRVCVYDGEGEAALHFFAGAGGTCDGRPCWRASSSSVVYSDKSAGAGGLTSLSIKAGADGKASIKLKAKGAGIAFPDLPLAMEPGAVRAVLYNEETDVCWLAAFSEVLGDPESTTKTKLK